MLPILYYAVLIPFVLYVVPATIIYLLAYWLYINRLSASSAKLYFTSKWGKVVVATLSLIVVLLIYVILVFVIKIEI
jgi:hypothetical protein